MMSKVVYIISPGWREKRCQAKSKKVEGGGREKALAGARQPRAFFPLLIPVTLLISISV